MIYNDLLLYMYTRHDGYPYRRGTKYSPGRKDSVQYFIAEDIVSSKDGEYMTARLSAHTTILLFYSSCYTAVP